LLTEHCEQRYILVNLLQFASRLLTPLMFMRATKRLTPSPRRCGASRPSRQCRTKLFKSRSNRVSNLY